MNTPKEEKKTRTCVNVEHTTKIITPIHNDNIYIRYIKLFF